MAVNYGPGLRQLEDGVRATPYVGDKRRAKPWLLSVVVLRRIVELVLSKFVKREDHSRKPRHRVSEHVRTRPPGSAARIPRRVPAFGLFEPELLVLLS